MKQVDRYVGLITAKGIVAAMAGFVSISLLISVIGDLGHIRENGPGLAEIFWQNVLLLPRLVYELFPSSALVGTLMGVGALAANSELTAFRAAGVSRGRISVSVMLGACLVLLPVIFVGEVVAPQAQLAAQNFKAQVNDRQISLGKNGVFWMQTAAGILKGYGVITPGKEKVAVNFYNLSLFKLNEDGHLKQRIDAVEAEQNGDLWTLKTVVISEFSHDGVKLSREKEINNVTLAEPGVLASSALDPQTLGVRELIVQIQYLNQHQLETTAYVSALWRRIAYPFYALVMVFIGMPFVFGSMRQSSMGQRLFIGILVGLSYYIISKTIINAAQVYQVPAWLAVFGPPAILAWTARFALKRSG